MDAPPKIVEQLLRALELPDSDPNLRPVHAIGIGATGAFVASRIARDYCVAEHFSGEREIKVTVRFSNGSGSAVQRDGWSDVRGMATRFHLANEAATDLIAMTLSEFFAPTPEAFLDFLTVAKPEPARVLSPLRKFLDLLQLLQPMPNPYRGQTYSPVPGAIRYADENTGAQLAVMHAANIGAPVSYARATYHAVHAFAIRAPDGVRRWVRFSWRPVAGVLNTDPTKAPIDNYLKQDLCDRLARGPARFTLMMTVGEPGDDPNDSSRPWPLPRLRVVMGELSLKHVIEDEVTEKLSFNPWRLVEGIEPSNDPVLQTRRDAYCVSSQRRGGAPCPFSGSSTHGGQ
jgi:catalase